MRPDDPVTSSFMVKLKIFKFKFAALRQFKLKLTASRKPFKLKGFGGSVLNRGAF